MMNLGPIAFLLGNALNCIVKQFPAESTSKLSKLTMPPSPST
jgi:hypothetical protein